MSISVNGQSVVPPGFRFHPTEEELLTYYLKKKVASERIDLDVIRDVDLNKLEPWDIRERCKIGSALQNDWYFFSHKDKKYPTGTRTNRATAAGFWKATGRDKAIYRCSSSTSSGRRIGMRKTLVFHKGRAPHGQKSDWIMHEYRLDDPSADAAAGDPFYPSPPPAMRGAAAGDQVAQQEEGWVICRVFKKKNLVPHHGQSSAAAAAATATSQQHATSKMAAAAPMESSPTSNCSSVTVVSDHAKAAQMMPHYSACSDDALDHILQYMGRPSSCTKQQQQQQQDTKPAAVLDHHLALTTTANTTACPPSSSVYGRFMKLPPLEHAGGGLLSSSPAEYGAGADASAGGIADWYTLDRLAASYELNGLSVDASKNMACFFDDPSGDGDLWSLARSVSSLHADLAMNNV